MNILERLFVAALACVVVFLVFDRDVQIKLNNDRIVSVLDNVSGLQDNQGKAIEAIMILTLIHVEKGDVGK